MYKCCRSFWGALLPVEIEVGGLCYIILCMWGICERPAPRRNRLDMQHVRVVIGASSIFQHSTFA